MPKPIIMGTSAKKQDPSQIWEVKKIKLNDWEWFYKEIRFWIYYEMFTENPEPLKRFEREFKKEYRQHVKDVSKLWNKLTRSLTVRDAELRKYVRTE